QGAFASHLANTPLAVLQLDRDRCIVQWTGRAESLFGWANWEALGMRLEELGLFEEHDRARFELELQELDRGGAERFTAAFRNLRRDETAVHGEWFGSVVRDEDGVDSYLMMVQDISARVSAEHNVQYVATHDLLTGLANRSQFEERLKADIGRARRAQGSLAVLLVDLD